jgi:hypothetical protein
MSNVRQAANSNIVERLMEAAATSPTTSAQKPIAAIRTNELSGTSSQNPKSKPGKILSRKS